MTKPITITIASFCRLTGLGRTSAYRLINSGNLEVIKLNRRTLITMESVDKLLEINRISTNRSPFSTFQAKANQHHNKLNVDLAKQLVSEDS